MTRILLTLSLVAALAACETPEQTQITGAATGALLGAAVSSDHDRAKGALIGGAVGLAAGALIGHDRNGRCVYQRRDGSRFVDDC